MLLPPLNSDHNFSKLLSSVGTRNKTPKLKASKLLLVLPHIQVDICSILSNERSQILKFLPTRCRIPEAVLFHVRLLGCRVCSIIIRFRLVLFIPGMKERKTYLFIQTRSHLQARSCVQRWMLLPEILSWSHCSQKIWPSRYVLDWGLCTHHAFPSHICLLCFLIIVVRWNV